MWLALLAIGGYFGLQLFNTVKSNNISVVGFRIFSIDFSKISLELDISINNAGTNGYSVAGSYFVLKYPLNTTVNNVLGTFYMNNPITVQPLANTKFTVKGDVPLLSALTLFKDYLFSQGKLPFEFVGTIRANNLISYTGKVYEDDFRSYLDKYKGILSAAAQFLGITKKK